MPPRPVGMGLGRGRYLRGRLTPSRDFLCELAHRGRRAPCFSRMASCIWAVAQPLPANLLISIRLRRHMGPLDSRPGSTPSGSERYKGVKNSSDRDRFPAGNQCRLCRVDDIGSPRKRSETSSDRGDRWLGIPLRPPPTIRRRFYLFWVSNTHRFQSRAPPAARRLLAVAVGRSPNPTSQFAGKPC